MLILLLLHTLSKNLVKNMLILPNHARVYTRICVSYIYKETFIIVNLMLKLPYY